ncbi:MAG: GntR family transcriptional regulator [Bifidobacteriaceae bacterium]|jgi:DNA-binding LacI/PurR family transcriptional regulator|nr:GntR family transcriptional regulator [Bifidobacteriaceae bacterium]MCI1978097.1 GntR family transcriptional regulator [Bifidobacteriaceae bacterium]
MLYQEVYEKLRDDIHAGKYPLGSKLPSVKQLCDTYAVSAITVRRALDILREEGFITRQPRIGTTVTNLTPDYNNQAKSHLPTIAFIMTSFADSFGTPLLEGALKQARGKAHLLLSTTFGDNEVEEEEISSAIDAGVNGLVLLPSDSDFIPKTILDLISKKFPVTIIDRVFQGVPVATVSSDNVDAARSATKYLFSLGHKNVAFISSSSHTSSNSYRRRGWALAHASNSISLNDDFLLNTISSTLPGAKPSEEESDIKLLSAFFKKHPDITACVAGEYNIALLVREALRRIKKTVPDDVSVVCFDHANYSFDRELFRFTHVEQQQGVIGSKSIELSLNQIQNGPLTTQILLSTSIVEGQSTIELRKKG